MSPPGRLGGLLLALVVAGGARPAGAGGPADLASFVDPFAGTAPRAADFGTGGGAGNTFPGAVAPFGMLQWSPDTLPSTANVGGGYAYGDAQIRGFSLTHLSGAGCAAFQDVPILPTARPLVASPAIAGSFDVRPDYVATFTHADEAAEPGYYRVRLDPETPQAVSVELAARTRSGVARFVFPPGAPATVLVNPGGSAMANDDVAITVDPAAHEIVGSVTSGQFCYHRNRYTLHFVLRFDHPFASWGTWTDDVLAPGGTSVSQHTESPFQLRFIPGIDDYPHATNVPQVGAYAGFEAGATIGVRAAISFTSVAGARRNLEAESADFDLARARAETRAAWNALLGRIEVAGGSAAATRTFYSMLYHALLAPTVFSDVDGLYQGMDGTPHDGSPRTAYANVSGWDVYRGAVQVLALLVPERASDMMESLVANARESGWLPRWSVASGQTDVMIGDPAAPIIAGAYAMGARDFDTAAALAALVKGATESGKSPNAEYVERQGLEGYLALGWVPHDGTEGSSGASTSAFGDTARVWGSAATTLEYAVADFAVARFARALGERATARTMLRRSGAWRNLYNPASGYLEPRYASGDFVAGFDPLSGEGFAEGNAVQYTWMVPFDPKGLFAALGGREIAAARLDAHLDELSAGPTSPHAFLGNEPELGVPWLYAWLGQPWKAQRTVREMLLTLFGDGADAYTGNDDLGTMSAVWIFGALGFYPAVPGEDVLVLGSPLFPEATVHLAGGDLEIRAPAAAPDAPYVHRLRLNGRRYRRSWLRRRKIARGGRLDFMLGSEPDTRWGARRPPPSFPARRGPG